MQNFANFRSKLTSAVSNIQDSARQAVAQGGGKKSIQELQQSQQSQQQQEYLRLPIASAKKLTWYDKGDIVQIVKQHLREKQEVLDANWALKRALLRRGIGEKELDQEVQLMLQEVDQIQENDAAVNNTLFIATQSKLDSLQQQNVEYERCLQNQQQRMQELQEMVDSMKLIKIDFEYSDSESPISVNLIVQQNLVSDAEASPQLPPDHFAIPADAIQQVSQALNIFMQADTKSQTLDRCLRLQEQLLDCAEQEELLKSLHEQSEGDEQMSIMIAKLQRLEGERRLHVEQMGELQQQIYMLNERDASLQAMTQKLQQVQQEKTSLKELIQKLQLELQDSEQQRKLIEQNAERKLLELRNKVGVSAAHHGEMLRRAQEVALDSEHRAEAADKRASRAEAKATRLEEELQLVKQNAKKLDKQIKDLERQREELSARASSAEAAADDAKMRTIDGDELRQAIRKVEEKFEDQLKEAENKCQYMQEERTEFQRKNSRLSEVQNRLEKRVLDLEKREGKLQTELSVAEGVVQERDELQIRNRALEEKLEEYKSKHQQTEDYKQVANQLESARLQAEQELLTTAKMVTVLEEKLREVQQGSRSAQLRAEEAEQKVALIESDIDARVRQLVEESGKDPSRWPQGAQTEINRLQTKLDTLQTLINSLQGQLEMETSQLNEQVSLKEALHRKIEAVEQRATVREQQALQMVVEVERKLNETERQLQDYRQHIDVLQEENDRLLMQKSMTRNSSGVMMKGGGSIHDIADGFSQNGDGYQDGIRNRIGGVDIIYLRNVLFKFIEALATGRQSERDALLPVIATLVQAGPREFKELKKAIQESSQSTSVLSVLGGRTSSGGSK
eukprot:TRINITY_DN25062_c1_g1_i1.p1 TRINITY_DN25062_c1_g1~~TRINITY_DN25062_c1_g1_i1.p1  ORF type:complete len:851 (-),score=158.34 TRINITY_DN25062_c1_g1_i1:584-3136(-)